jgi:purine-binding chemotaxis protein CheW
VARAPGDSPGGLLDSIVDGETFLELAAEGSYRQTYGAGDEEGERAECLAFRVGDEEYALEIGHLREIIFPPPITQVPRAPANVVGVLALRGSMVTVVDLRQRLGFPDIPLTVRSRILVVHHDGELFGLVVDGVSEVVRFVPTAVEPPPPTHRRLEMDVVKGVLHRGGQLLIMLDLERVLSFGVQPGGRAQEDR